MPSKPRRPDDEKAKRRRSTPAGTADVVIDGQTYTTGAEAAEELRKAIRGGSFTGFRSYGDDEHK